MASKGVETIRCPRWAFLDMTRRGSGNLMFGSCMALFCGRRHSLDFTCLVRRTWMEPGRARCLAAISRYIWVTASGSEMSRYSRYMFSLVLLESYLIQIP